MILIKDKKFDNNEAEKVQRNNVNKAIEIAEEIGIEYYHGKFTNFPVINFLGVSDLFDDSIFRVQYYLGLFGIDLDINFIDRNASYTYQDAGLYEVSATKWVADFLDPATWIAIFASKKTSKLKKFDIGIY